MKILEEYGSGVSEFNNFGAAVSESWCSCCRLAWVLLREVMIYLRQYLVEKLVYDLFFIVLLFVMVCIVYFLVVIFILIVFDGFVTLLVFFTLLLKLHVLFCH